MSHRRLAIALSLPLLGCLSLVLVGCGTSGTPINSSAPPDLTGNWQIQNGGTAISTPGVALLGALSSNGTQVTGTSRITNFSFAAGCINQVVTVSGSIDANRMLTLTSAPVLGSVVQVSLTVPPVTTSFGVGTIQVTGGACAFASSPAVGGLIQPVTGSYAGPLSPGPVLVNPLPATASATLQLSQASTPNPDGQFAVTGTLQFVSGSCSTTTQLAGTVSGVGITLSASSFSPASLTTVQATTSLTASQILVGFILDSPAPCSTSPLSTATYSGTLTRQ